MATTISPNHVTPSGVFAEHHLLGITARLEVHGEWIRHVQPDGNEEWTVAQFHNPAQSTGLGGIEIEISANDAYLTGRADYFSVKPVKWREPNPAVTGTGSKIWVDGYLYQVQDVKTNRRGSIRIELVKDECCLERNATWDADVAAIGCQSTFVPFSAGNDAATNTGDTIGTDVAGDGVKQDADGNQRLDILGLDEM